MAGRPTQTSRKLCQNIFDVHRFDLLNVLDTLREAFYILPEEEESKIEEKHEEKQTVPTASVIPEPVQTLTPPAQPLAQARTTTSPSPLGTTIATPPPVISVSTPQATVQDTAIPTNEQPTPDAMRRTPSLPPRSSKPELISHVQRRLVRLLKKEPTKYDESEILKTLAHVFHADSSYTRMEQLRLARTLAVVAKGMRKKNIMGRLSQVRAGLLHT
ncbi:hypothetical protein Unana1_04895 [Umbelopsis nana]